MTYKSRKTTAYLVLVAVISILLMSLWICLRVTAIPPFLLWIGTVILYLATFAGLLRGIIWTIEHFVKWIEKENEEDEA